MTKSCLTCELDLHDGNTAVPVASHFNTGKRAHPADLQLTSVNGRGTASLGCPGNPLDLAEPGEAQKVLGQADAANETPGSGTNLRLSVLNAHRKLGAP